MKIKSIILALFLLCGFFSMQSCENEEPKPGISSEDSIYYFIDGLMQYWYLWNESLPEVDYLSYDEPQALIDDLKYSLDKWSFVDKTEAVNSLFQEGENYGYGFYLAWDENYQLRVIFVYNETDAYKQGIRRGCIITKMNDVAVRDIRDFEFFFSSDAGSCKFEYIGESGTTSAVTLTKKKYYMNGVLFSGIINADGTKTGYFVLESFLNYAQEDMDAVFTEFKSVGIEELIVDLRYNGGGYVKLAQQLANRIAPSAAIGKTFYTMKHNADRKAEYDTTVLIETDDLALDLDRVFFITNEYSASASELVINGLDPLMDVKTLGETSSGKPVAMYGFEFQDWVVFPVTAKSVNDAGYGEYFSGLVPDKPVTDPLMYNWGNLNDPALEQALHYIKYGTFGTEAAALKSTSGQTVIPGGNYFGRNWLIGTQH